uniref:GCC2 and GCC3 domain-containing protein n=1 Tax=Neospora caninum (strain Liverpool) TaxID=572307 RepID=A0A0F7U3N9_NEOCL|nr:TPA: GCC2 and GCC3 domain-containing protein [Neospora caninum Liverpool]
MEGRAETKTPDVEAPRSVVLSPRQAKRKTLPLSASEPGNTSCRPPWASSASSHLAATLVTTGRACQSCESRSKAPEVESATWVTAEHRRLKTDRVARRKLLVCFLLWLGGNVALQDSSRTGSPADHLGDNLLAQGSQNRCCTVGQDGESPFKVKNCTRCGECLDDVNNGEWARRSCSAPKPVDACSLDGVLRRFSFSNFPRIIPRRRDRPPVLNVGTVTPPEAVHSIKSQHNGNFMPFVPFAFLGATAKEVTSTDTTMPGVVRVTPPRRSALKQEGPDWHRDDVSFGVVTDAASADDTRKDRRYDAPSPSAETFPASAAATETSSENLDAAKSPDTDRVAAHPKGVPSGRPNKVNSEQEPVRKVRKGYLQQRSAFPWKPTQLHSTADGVRHVQLTGNLRPSYVKGSAIEITAEVRQAEEIDRDFAGDVFFSLYSKDEGPLGAATQQVPESRTSRVRAKRGIVVARPVLETEGEVAIRIHCGGCVSTITPFFSVTKLTARRLVLSRQPSNSVAGVPLPDQPVVRVVNADGSPAQGRVVVEATLLTVETTDEGVAVFRDLAVSLVGDAYFLRFAFAEPYSSFPSTYSWPFAIEHGPAAGLRFATEPPAEVLPGEHFSVSIDIVDRWGNSVSGMAEDAAGNPAEITLGLAGTSTSTSLTGTRVREATGGPLLFDGLAITDIFKGDLQLEASCAKCLLAPAQSHLFKISLTNVARISKCPLLYEDGAVSTEVPPPSAGQGTYGFSFNTCVYQIALLADESQLLAPKHEVIVTVAGIALKDAVPGLQGERLPEERFRITPRTLTFSPSNYHVPQDILLEVADDNEIVASSELTNVANEMFVGDYIIRHTMRSADKIWNDGIVKWEVASGDSAAGTEHFIDFMNGGDQDRAFATEGNLMVRVVDDDRRRVITKTASTIRMEGEPVSCGTIAGAGERQDRGQAALSLPTCIKRASRAGEAIQLHTALNFRFQPSASTA